MLLPSLPLVLLRLSPLLVLFSGSVVVVLVIVVLLFVAFCGVTAVTSNVFVADAGLYPLASVCAFTVNIPVLEFPPICHE